MRAKRRAVIVLVPVITVLLLALVSWPTFLNARKESQRNVCMQHLRQLSGGKGSMGLAENLTNGTPVTWEMIDAYVKGGSNAMVCPLDPKQSCASSYELGPLGTVPRCKICSNHNEYPPRARRQGLRINGTTGDYLDPATGEWHRNPLFGLKPPVSLDDYSEILRQREGEGGE